MAMTAGEGILAANVAQRYYIDQQSKVQIAEDLGISRFRVARLLDMATAEGIVRFVITPPLSIDGNLSERIRRRFNLRQVLIVDAVEDEADPPALRRRVGAAAAKLLSDLVTEQDVLGIGWGRTTSAMTDELTHLAGCPVVQLGGMAGSVNENSLELVRRISQIGGGKAYPLFVPLIVPDANTAQGLQTQPGVDAAKKLFGQVTIGVTAVGSWNPPESQMRNALSQKDREILAKRGVVAEVLATLIKGDGKVETGFDDRTTAMRYEALREIPELILVAAGAVKANAVHAALKASLGTTLVADASLARTLLRLS